MNFVLSACDFATERIVAKEWHSLSPSEWQLLQCRELASVVADLLTERVTRSLPFAWQGDFTAERAQRWVDERDAEGATLLVIDSTNGRAVGLVITHEANSGEDGGTDVRLGYLLSEEVWGKGIATELVSGFAKWCREHASIRSLSAGVSHDNRPSRRVLEKAGFQRVEEREEAVEDELLYRLTLR